MSEIKDGVYFDMPFIEYQNARGFSASAAKELLVDPLGYWFKKNQPYKEMIDFIGSIKPGPYIFREVGCKGSQGLAV